MSTERAFGTIENTNENEEQKEQEMIIKLGGLLHDEWREPRKIDDGKYEPRVKVFAKTTDGKEKWFDENKLPVDAQEIKRQDIANTSFQELDPSWQEENKKAADVAMGEVFRAVKDKKVLDEKFIEEASAIVHDKWLERNSWVKDPNYGNPDLAKPYQDLSEEEKEKDRAQVKKAISIFEASK